MRSSPEFELIERVRDALRAAGVEPGGSVVGIGDDAAITPVAEGVLATSIDLFADGVHFTSAFSDRQIGHKALAAALSDLAAMGAEPREAYVGIVAPPGFDAERAVAIAAGIGAVASRHRVTVLGGDVSAGAQLCLAVTVIGWAPSAERLVTRSGARPGDALLISGSVGAAAAGLVLLDDRSAASGLPSDVAEALIERQLCPHPQLELGAVLAAAGATAMIDVSDGVLADAEQIASESGVEIELRTDMLPIAEGVSAVAAASGRDPLSLAGAGEDYELLVTMPAAALERARAAAEALGQRLTEIGLVRQGAGVSLAGDGAALGQGFDHLGR